MSTKTWSHISPTKGVDTCGAQSPETCKFKETSRHFTAKAAERIKTGRPANFDEYEAMMKHREAIGDKSEVKPFGGAPKPAPGPQQAAKPTLAKAGFKPTQLSQRPAPRPFPTAPQTGLNRNVAPFPGQSRAGGFQGGKGGYKSNVPRSAETLYHMELGFPKNFNPPTGVHELEYSRHAVEATQDDRYGAIPVLKKMNVDRLKMVELGVQDGRVSKIVYRGTLDEERDMCIVVIPKPAGQKWFVKTVWINLRSDQHRTLDESKYARPAA
jgi:hypothetical protein